MQSPLGRAPTASLLQGTSTAGMQMLRQDGSRPAQPLLLLATLNITAAKTENRPIEQYEHSAYSYWKLIWRGVRTSPGSLWYVFYALAIATSLLCVTAGRKLIGGPWSLTLEAADLCINNLMTGMLFYVSLAVTQLSDLMEAYLVALCSIQLALDTQRCVSSTSWLRDFFGMVSSLLAVMGIILLDSYGPLNVHYDVYCTIVTTLMSVQIAGSATQCFDEDDDEEIRSRVNIMRIVLSVCHFVFLVVAFVLADREREPPWSDAGLPVHRGRLLHCNFYHTVRVALSFPWHPSSFLSGSDSPGALGAGSTLQAPWTPDQTPQTPWAPAQTLQAPWAPAQTLQAPWAPDQTPQPQTN